MTLRTRKGFVIGACAMALAALAHCSHPSSPEEQVRRTLSEMEQAARDRSVRHIKEFLSEQYHDEQQNDRQSVGALLTYYFFQNRSVHIFSRVKEIDVTGPAAAEAQVVAALAGRPIAEPSELAGANASLYRFDFTLVREGEEWKIATARWRPAEVGDFF